jgi:hypothetical protein
MPSWKQAKLTIDVKIKVQLEYAIMEASQISQRCKNKSIVRICNHGSKPN